jgi:hypothetical protein
MRQFLDALPGRPSRADVLVVVGVLLLLLGGASLGRLAWSSKATAPSPDPGLHADLQVSSNAPSGASLLVDAAPRGRVPTIVTVAPGLHTVCGQDPPNLLVMNTGSRLRRNGRQGPLPE